MSERTLKQLVGALAVAVGVWAVAGVFSRGSGSIGAGGAVSRVFEGVTPETLEWVTMSRSGADSVHLERAAGRWTANGFPADSSAVTRLLEVLRDAEVTDLAATNPANHDRMGVSADSAVVLTLSAGGRARTVLVGRGGRRFGTAYVRLPDSQDVYLLDGDVRAQVTRRLDDWRNRTMVALDTARVARVEIQHGTDAFDLVRGDSAWTVDGGGEASGAAVTGLLSELARLVATGFVAETDSIAALGRASTMRAFDADGALLAEITIGAGETDRWARTASDAYLYRISSFRAARVAPTRETVAGGS